MNRDGDRDRLAADLTIFNVLGRALAQINKGRRPLAAVRAFDFGTLFEFHGKNLGFGAAIDVGNPKAHGPVFDV